jgi:hypothetical protein
MSLIRIIGPVPHSLTFLGLVVTNSYASFKAQQKESLKIQYI